MVAKNLEALQGIFPEAFSEDGVDFKVLRELLGDTVADGEEKYGLTWHGKRNAGRIALTPSLGTLRPCREESVDWDRTQNLFIEGDNLEVLKLLQKSYANTVKMIYIDPPYNTGKEFIYPDRFQDNLDTYLKYTGQKDDEGFKISSNTESSGRYHTNWLNMMFPRLKLARGLLKDDGVIFISINDHEMHHLRTIMDDIFGEENFVSTLLWKNKSGGASDSKNFAIDHEYIFSYAKDINVFRIKKDPCAEVSTLYNYRDKKGRYALDRLDKQSIRYSKSLDYKIKDSEGSPYLPKHKNIKSPNATWRWSKKTVKERYHELVFKNNHIYTKNYEKEEAVPRSLLVDRRFGRTRTGKTEFFEIFENNYFPNPKPSKLIVHLLRIATNKDDIILDFFAGSATSSHAVMWRNAEDGGNRTFIMVQLPEPCAKESEACKAGYKTIAEIGKERIRRAAAKIKKENPTYKGDLGFKVFKLDSSNIRAWNPNPNDLEQALTDHTEHLDKGRSEEDILYELLLRRGVDLTVSIEEKIITSKTVYSIGYGSLFACLDTSINRKEVEDLALGIIDWHTKLEPASDTHVVFRDSAFEDDVAKTNITAILEQHGIAHVRSL